MTEGDASAPAPSVGLGRLLEHSLLVPLRAASIFEDHAQRPEPSRAVLAVNLAFWSALSGGAAAALHRAGPQVPWLPPPLIMAAAGTAGCLLAGILALVFLHALAGLLGGKGSFTRSLEIISVGSGIVPLTLLLSRFEGLWVIPSLLAVYVCAVGLRRLHATPLAPTWAACGMLGGLAVAGQGFARLQFERLSASAPEAAITADPMQGLASELQKMAAAHQALLALPAENSTVNRMLPVAGQGFGAPPAETTQAPEWAPAATGPPSPEGGRSGLPQGAGAKGPSAADIDAMQISMQGLLANLAAILNNPALQANMAPQQRQMMADMMSVVQKSSQGKDLPPEEINKLMKHALQMMGQAGAVSRPGAAPKIRTGGNRPGDKR